MATPTIKPHQVAESFVAVPGIIIEMIRSTVSPTATAVDGSWTDILTGTFEVPIAGTYKLTWNGAVYTNGGSGTYRANFRLNFDSGDQLISDSTTKITMYTGEERVPYFHQLEVELTAGTHTVAAQWIATTGSGVLQCNTDDFVVLTGLLASGSGAGGTLLASAENASDQTVSVDSTPVLLTDLSLNFTSVEEKVELGWHLHTYKNTGGSSPMGRAIFYRVDGGSWVHIANSSSEYEKTFSGSHVISVAPGSHTVDFAFMTNSQPVVLMGGGSTVPWLASAGFYPKCQTWVQRYRGGLVPVERDGEIVHSTPRALNFTGASLQVSESNDVVDIGLSDAVTAPGDLITLTDGPPGSALQINSSGDHQIMPETGSLSFEAKVTGTYAILLSGELIAISSNTSAQIKLVFDEGESYAQTVGYTDGWLCRPTTGNYTEPVFKDEVSLTAGTHTVKAYGKRVEGTGSVQITPGNVHPLVLTLQAIVGSGAGGMIVDHAVKDVDQNITANVLTALTGLTHTLTVGEDEDFDLSYAIIFYSGANHTSAVLYRVDGGDWIWTARKGTGGAYPGYLTGVETIRLTAGTHTIELGSVHDSGSTYTVYAPGDWKGATGLGSRSTIRQHRGGLVPIRNSGVQVVDKPAALNFEGALEVQNASGVANIRMPDAITAPGQIQTLTEGQPSSAINYDGTETQIYPESGSDSYTVTTAGKHRVDLNLTSAGNGADWNTYQYRVVFDEGLSTEVSIGYTEGWRARFNNGLWAQPAFSGNVDLEAKTYTIKVFGQRILGSGSAYISDTTLTQQPVTLLVTAVTGSGAAGILVDEALKPSDQTGISAGTITKITDLDLTFTASLGENVEISWEIFSALSTGTEAHRALFLKVDSGSWSFAGATFTGWHSVFDGSRVLEGLAAGSHTVEFGVRHDSGSTLIVYGTSEIWAGTGAMQSRTAATQFRGGLVPITDDFTTVDKPTSQKFVNASVTDDAGQAVVTLPEAVTVPGDLIEISDGIPSGAIAIGTDTQFIPETGSPMAFTVLSAGQYRAELDFGFYVTNGGTNTSIQVKLVFDEGEAHEQTLGYTEQWEARGIADGGYVYPHFGGTVDLTAGAHTLIAYAKETNGSDAVIAASAPRVTLTALAGSGAQGNLLAEAATTVNNTVTALSPSVLPTEPLLVSFDSTDENITIHFNGLIANTYSGATTVVLQLWLDGSATGAHQLIIPTAGWYESASFSIPVAVTAGSHTVEIYAYTGTSQQFRLQAGAKLWVMQDRGGLVPIKNDGALVQDTPHSINLLGPGLQGTNVNGAVHVSVNSAAEGVELLHNESFTSPIVITANAASSDDSQVPTGATATITTVEGEVVKLTFTGSGLVTDGTANQGAMYVDLFVDTTLDNPEQVLLGKGNDTTSQWENLSFTREIGPLAAGSHTLRVGFRRWDATQPWNLYYGKLQVTRYRGGYVVPENVPQLAYNSASVVDVSPKAGTSSRLWLLLSDGARYYADGTQTIDLTTTGLGGLDTGSEAVSTWYYCYAVPGSASGTFDVVASETNVAGGGPTGYAAWRYLGCFYNDSSSDIRKFAYVKGWHRIDDIAADANVAVGPSPTLNAWTATDLSAVAPSGMFSALEVCGFAMGESGDYSATFVGPTSPGWTPADNQENAVRALMSTQSWPCVDTNNKIIATTTGLDYYVLQRGGTPPLFQQWAIRISAFRDLYLDGEGDAQAQTDYQPDTPPPRGTWIDTTEVDFAAWPGHPSTLRLALSDGKTRIASGTLAVDKNNGVADLGYDDASSQGNSKWLYFYAVPKTGNDDQFTIVMSDNEPATGPLGRSASKYLWSTYIDGSGNLREVVQISPGHFRSEYQAISHDGLAPTSGSVEESLTNYVPKTASAVNMAVMIESGSWYSSQLFRESGGPILGFQYCFAAAMSDEVVMPLGYDGSGNPRFYYDTNGGGSATYYRFLIFGWIDEYLSPDAGIGVAIGGGGTTSPLTTKGDIYTYDTDNARLGVGSNGQVLTADSAEATGIKWATPSSASSYLREESFSTTGSETPGDSKTHVIAATPNTAGTTSGYDVLVYRNGLKMKNVGSLGSAYDEFTFTVGTLTVEVLASGDADEYEVVFRS